MDKLLFNYSYSDDENPNSHNKSNSINTIRKFYNPGVEFVHTLSLRNKFFTKDLKHKPKNRSLMEKKVIKEDNMFKGKFDKHIS